MLVLFQLHLLCYVPMSTYLCMWILANFQLAVSSSVWTKLNSSSNWGGLNSYLQQVRHYLFITSPLQGDVCCSRRLHVGCRNNGFTETFQESETPGYLISQPLQTLRNVPSSVVIRPLTPPSAAGSRYLWSRGQTWWKSSRMMQSEAGPAGPEITSESLSDALRELWVQSSESPFSS